MEKEKFLLRLSLELDTFKAHVNRLKPDGYTIHPLDVELLRNKIYDLYDLVLSLDVSPKNVTVAAKPEVIVKIENPKVEKPPQKPEVANEPPEQLVAEIPKTETAPPPVNTKPEYKDVVIQEEEQPTEQTIASAIETPIQPLPIEPTHEEVLEKPQMAIPESKKTTLDLFSGSDDNLLAKTFSDKTVDNSLAGRMQKERITNIRSAIGINEKFLFLNELFKGDLSRYNRVIDELNALQTKQGVETYLIELKVAGQWKNDFPAYQKLEEIVLRKF